jgi:putative effector of murein hydrolase
MNRLHGLSFDPLVLLLLTIGTFLFGVAVQRRTQSAVANPTLISIVLVGLYLRVAEIPYGLYLSANQALNFLLGPATVALAIPLVLAIEHLKRGLLRSLVALVAGSVVGSVSAYTLVRACGGDRSLALSMMPKSVTVPIAIGIAKQIGGVPALSAVFAIAAGILVAITLPSVLRLLRVDDPAATGLAAGTAGSGIATARVIPMGPVPAAFAGVALGVNGLITAVLAPVFAKLFAHL